MKITIESTSKIVELHTSSGVVPARIWEGTSESGIALHAFVTRVAVDRQEDCSQFERELLEQRTPTAAIATYPPRLILGSHQRSTRKGG